MTVVELVLAIGLFGALLLAATHAMRMLSLGSGTINAEAVITNRIFDATHQISSDIRLSGATPDGVYPHLVDDPSAPGTGFDAHVHEAPTPFDEANREVIFVRAADLDDNGVPDINLDGSLVWDTQEISYVLLPSIKGRNQIERHVDGVFERVIARDVESMTFDDSASSSGVVPAGYLRLRLVMSVDANGQTLRRRVERLLHLVQEIN